MSQMIEVVHGSRVAVVWLNRPEIHNALNEEMVAQLTQAIHDSSHDPETVAVVLASRGDAFCAGVDLAWYQRYWEQGGHSSQAPARALAHLLKTIDCSPVPVIARVNGHCIGAGIGLVAACDMAFASHDAEFSQPETGLGLVPQLVAPYLSRAIGARTAGRWLMMGETFPAAEAWRMGLLQEICEASELDARINAVLGHLMLTEPNAVRLTREMLKSLPGGELDHAQLTAKLEQFAPRVDSPAREGVNAFIEKRWPDWVPDELKS
ncbi:enoyl-CoA hydratase-related protein [Zwartia sp.]|uniref:enoyl-CoA hydratase-related protein n=1 Tax=Zwartia sp. TaxID=2978004 RepID=UPI002720E763|nr:enoyl-CoA hydratase-related protein [Zwartia sp.]MDO9023177.1 enoyl-CoA hydratase-related protein [Zwartia sp.]